ncbi:hypothetical protein BDZ89DRAFT_1159761 [Hymenopellis radicata]|nr:hypothetical protein BDZ89DRAFT_1159761 [Hymenopellis radicata]
MSSVAGPSQPRKRAISDISDSNRPHKKLKESSPARKSDKKRRRKKKRKGSIAANNTTTPTIISKALETDSETLSSTSPPPMKKNKGKGKQVAVESSQDIIIRLTEELQAQSLLLKKHDDALRHVQNNMTCQICLDVLRRPYALAPCGHVSCHSCLLNWFSRENEAKTCPHCRSQITKRPIEIWTIKSTVLGLLKTGLLTDVPETEERPLPTDPWNGLFRTLQQQESQDEQDLMGVYDAEDNIYRCQDCMHEIWDGVCSSCERLYPDNHRRREDHLGGANGMMLGMGIYNFLQGGFDAISVEDDDGDEDDEEGEGLYEDIENDYDYEGSFIDDDEPPPPIDIDVDAIGDESDEDYPHHYPIPYLFRDDDDDDEGEEGDDHVEEEVVAQTLPTPRRYIVVSDADSEAEDDVAPARLRQGGIVLSDDDMDDDVDVEVDVDEGEHDLFHPEDGDDREGYDVHEHHASFDGEGYSDDEHDDSGDGEVQEMYYDEDDEEDDGSLRVFQRTCELSGVLLHLRTRTRNLGKMQNDGALRSLVLYCIIFRYLF